VKRLLAHVHVVPVFFLVACVFLGTLKIAVGATTAAGCSPAAQLTEATSADKAITIAEDACIRVPAVEGTLTCLTVDEIAPFALAIVKARERALSDASPDSP
jgi:hypothetical protein